MVVNQYGMGGICVDERTVTESMETKFMLVPLLVDIAAMIDNASNEVGPSESRVRIPLRGDEFGYGTA